MAIFNSYVAVYQRVSTKMCGFFIAMFNAQRVNISIFLGWEKVESGDARFVHVGTCHGDL